MVVKKESMLYEVRSKLKDGKGDISCVNLDCTNEKNCRLISEMTVPLSASIGNHTHINETEYYIILEGKGLAADNGVQHTVGKGDIIITKHGESHSLENVGESPLKLLAIIITY